MAAERGAEARQTKLIDSIDEIAERYDALLCDLWGCYHNGVSPFESAVAALRRFRDKGGVVVLLTNAPRPQDAVKGHLTRMGGPPDSYDGIVTSGDATRAEVASARWGRKLHIVGPSRDDTLWRGLDIETVPFDAAEAILCTGLFDDRVETPADYADMIAAGVARDLPLLCANPDIVVDRGEQRLYCAGAIAAAYTEAGGRSIYFGKPHPPIYALAFDEARRLFAARRGADAPALETARVLAVGDGVATDVLGAEQMGIDCVFVTGGLAAAEVGDTADAPDPTRLAQYLVSHGRDPAYAIPRLG